jgi:hypothetical protein
MLAAASALVVPELFIPRKSIFLPPVGGWAKTYASLIIPREDAHYWAQEIKDGKASYDDATETMSWHAEPSYPEPQILEDMKRYTPRYRMYDSEVTNVKKFCILLSTRVDKIPIPYISGVP